MTKRGGAGLAIAVLALTGLLLFFHLFRLGSLPEGFFIDESAIGYNAWSIALTGADEYGTRYPLFFRCFDNYHDPVMVYLLAPLLKWGGPQKWLVRLPSALFHVLAALAFGLVVYEYVRSRALALAGVAVFGVLPWGFALSRSIMAGYTPMLLGMCVGWWALLRVVRLGSPLLAAVAGLAWAFAMYAHNIGRPMTAVLLVCFAAAFHRAVLERWRCAVVFAATLVVSLVPMALAVVDSPALTERFAELAVWRDSPGVAVVVERIAVRYLEYFSPDFLFVSGDANRRHHTGLRGELYLALAPLLLAGLYQTVRAFPSDPKLRFLLLAWLTYPAAAVLTVSHMHSTRSLNGVVPWCLLAAVGAAFLSELGPWARRAAAALGVLLLVESVAYLNDYFGPYAERSRAAFDAHFVEALERACPRLASGDTLYVSASMLFQLSEVPALTARFEPFYYVHPLFFCQVPPASYQAGGFPSDRIRPYTGTASIDRPGLLLRSKFLFSDANGKVEPVPNPEPVPDDARLITESTDALNVFQLLRVKRSSP